MSWPYISHRTQCQMQLNTSLYQSPIQPFKNHSIRNFMLGFRVPHAPLNGKQMPRRREETAQGFYANFLIYCIKCFRVFLCRQATKAKEIVSICHDNFFEMPQLKNVRPCSSQNTRNERKGRGLGTSEVAMSSAIKALNSIWFSEKPGSFLW